MGRSHSCTGLPAPRTDRTGSCGDGAGPGPGDGGPCPARAQPWATGRPSSPVSVTHQRVCGWPAIAAPRWRLSSAASGSNPVISPGAFRKPSYVVNGTVRLTVPATAGIPGRSALAGIPGQPVLAGIPDPLVVAEVEGAAVPGASRVTGEPAVPGLPDGPGWPGGPGPAEVPGPGALAAES